MSKIKTISIPSNVGSSTLSETFGKITFSPEVRELLTAMQAEIHVRYNVGAEKPTIEVRSTENKAIVCSLDEFKALSGSRRFVADLLKKLDREKTSDKKTEVIAYFVRKAKECLIPVPERMLEQNFTKFNQFGNNIEMLKHHLEIIGDLIDNEWKDYLLAKLKSIGKVLLDAQTKCMGAELVEKDYVYEKLFSEGIPKWIYSKVLDKNFTNNVKENAVTLLFPKNNYTKSIGLTTKEIEDDSFLVKNKLITKNSGSLIQLIKSNRLDFLKHLEIDVDEQIEVYLQTYTWVMVNPYTVEEILSLREAGKFPPAIRDVMPSTKTGKNFRPENELAKKLREIGNVLGRVQHTLNGIMNFIVAIASPKTEFWVELYPNAAQWEITPSNTIYNCIRKEDNLNPLKAIRACSSEKILKRIASIVAQGLMVPAGTADFLHLEGVFLSLVGQDTKPAATGFEPEIVNPGYDGVKSMELELQRTPVIDDEKEIASKFLGQGTKKHQKKKKRSGSSAVKPSKTAMKTLDVLKNEEMFSQIIDWLVGTFKSKGPCDLQNLAAERIVGDVYKHHEEIFGEDYDEDDLESEDED